MNAVVGSSETKTQEHKMQKGLLLPLGILIPVGLGLSIVEIAAQFVLLLQTFRLSDPSMDRLICNCGILLILGVMIPVNFINVFFLSKLAKSYRVLAATTLGVIGAMSWLTIGAVILCMFLAGHLSLLGSVEIPISFAANAVVQLIAVWFVRRDERKRSALSPSLLN